MDTEGIYPGNAHLRLDHVDAPIPALLADMPVNDRDGGLWFSFEEARTARAALFLAVHHRDSVASPDALVHTLTGHDLDELISLMADIDALTDARAHRLALEEHLVLAMGASDDELIRRHRKFMGLLEEARRLDVPVPPELEHRLANPEDASDIPGREHL